MMAMGGGPIDGIVTRSANVSAGNDERFEYVDMTMVRCQAQSHANFGMNVSTRSNEGAHDVNVAIRGGHAQGHVIGVDVGARGQSQPDFSKVSRAGGINQTSAIRCHVAMVA